MNTNLNRRTALKGLGLATIGAGLMNPFRAAADDKKASNGLPPVKITKVKAIATCPHGTELVVVKVETSEPGLFY